MTLLKRIRLAKAKRVKSGELRSPRDLEFSDDEENLFALPLTWQWVRLADMGAIIGGGTPPSGESANFTDGGKGIGWLTPADLGKHKGLFISYGARDLTAAGMSAGSATLMPKGSVLFTSRAPIGYVAIAANEISTNQGFKSVVPYLPDCSRYIAIYLRAFGPWVNSKATGTTFKEVSGKIVSGLPFPLAPLAEQHRIVAKVDELMALCDQLEAAHQDRERRRDSLVAASLQRLNQPAADTTPQAQRKHARFHLRHLPRLTTRPEHITAMRKFILDFAIKGKLVAQDSNDEPATELIQRIRDRKLKLIKQKLLKPEKALPAIREEEKHFILPKGWVWSRLGYLTHLVTSGSRDWAKHYSDTGPIFVRMGNLSRNSYQLRMANVQRVNPPENGEGKRTSLKAGDVLISITGEVGLLGLIPPNFGAAYINQHTCMVRPSPELSSRFLPELFRSTFAQVQFNTPQRGLKNSFS